MVEALTARCRAGISGRIHFRTELGAFVLLQMEVAEVVQPGEMLTWGKGGSLANFLFQTFKAKGKSILLGSEICLCAVLHKYL